MSARQSARRARRADRHWSGKADKARKDKDGPVTREPAERGGRKGERKDQDGQAEAAKTGVGKVDPGPKEREPMAKRTRQRCTRGVKTRAVAGRSG